jgi:hypothetical protein
MGFGIDISELDDAEVSSLIAQASSVVDAYCNVPRIPQKHDFRGGTITGEQHAWRYPTNPFEIGQRRYYPFHWPVVSISQFRIYVTNTQYVEIAPTELMINNTERYFEVVSLAITSSGLFNALIVPNVGLATPIARCSYTYGWDFTVTDEELSCSDGQTWRAQNQFWFTDTDRAPVIKKNGAVQSSGYTVNANEGSVVFADNLVATDSVTATYHHKLPSDLQYGTGHIVAYLHGQAELHSRGMAHLNRLRVAEVEMTRQNLPATGSLAENLDILIPEASLLLSSYRTDFLTVR